MNAPIDQASAVRRSHGPHTSIASPPPRKLAKDPYAVVVAAAFDDSVAEDLDALAGFNDHLRAWAYQEYVDAEDDAVYVMTNRLV